MHGQKLFEFVLDSARRQVEETIPDQREFYLSPKAHEAYLAILDTPAKPDERLKAMLTRKPIWDRCWPNSFRIQEKSLWQKMKP